MGIRGATAHHPDMQSMTMRMEGDRGGGIRRRRGDPGRDARLRRPVRSPTSSSGTSFLAVLTYALRPDGRPRRTARSRSCILMALPLSFLAVGTDRLARVVAAVRARRRRRDWIAVLPAGIVASRTVDLGDGRLAPTLVERSVRPRGHPRGGRRDRRGRGARDPRHGPDPPLAHPPRAGLRRPPLHGGGGRRSTISCGRRPARWSPRSSCRHGWRCCRPSAACRPARRDRLARMLERRRRPAW